MVKMIFKVVPDLASSSDLVWMNGQIVSLHVTCILCLCCEAGCYRKRLSEGEGQMPWTDSDVLVS